MSACFSIAILTKLAIVFRDLVAPSPELSDDDTVTPDGHIIDSVATERRTQGRFGCKNISWQRWRYKGDLCACRHCHRTEAVARAGKCRICQHKENAAMSCHIAIDHVIAHYHAGGGSPGAYL